MAEPVCTTLTGWLEYNGTSPVDGTRIKEIKILPYTMHSTALNNLDSLQNRLKKGGNFAVKQPKNSLGEKQVILFLEIDDVNIRVTGGDIKTVFNTNSYELTCTKRNLAQTCIDIAGQQVDVFEYIRIETVSADTNNELEEFKKVLDSINNVYLNLPDSQLSVLIDNFQLIKRPEKLTDMKLKQMKSL